MRILVVNDFYAPYIVGGAETLVQELVAGLSARNHDVAVATARIEGTPQREVLQGIPIFRVGRFPAINRALEIASGTAPSSLAPVTISDFWAATNAFQPSVVHFHNVWLLGPASIQQTGA